MRLPQCRSSFSFLMMWAVVFLLGCGGPTPLTVGMPLHLEDHLDAATIVGSEVPADLVESVEWRFDEPQPDWRPAKPIPAQWEAVEPVRVDDALRLPLTAENSGYGAFFGMIYVDLPAWELEDWAYVEIRARTKDPMRYIGLAFNYTEKDPVGAAYAPFYSPGDRALLVGDGTVQTYRLSLDWPQMRSWEGPWTHLGIFFSSLADEGAVTLDILSVRVIPREAEYAGDRVGVGTEQRSKAHRRTLYSHAPGRLEYHVKVPDAGRLDVGLGVLSDDAPVTFSITATQQDGTVETLLEETYADREHWAQRSIDLFALAGQTITLTLQADAEKAGTVAFWAAPTVSAPRQASKPNVIFYVIDGGGADYMSVYGYNRRTTPHMEKLAAEGVVFERAYSNSSWSKPSTTSFMTSLQNSVLGNTTRGRFDPLPEEAVTMAQHFHRAGYQTAVFTSNPFAASMSSLDRGVDVMRDAGADNDATSSVELHEDFWNWREAYPGEPYWVHFQTTDVHENFPAVAPFSGLFVGPEQLKTWRKWHDRLREKGDHGIYSEAWEKTGLSRVAFYTLNQGLYDETMAHNDYQLGRLVERLKAEGEWENTLLIIGADHSIRAAWDDMGIAIQDSVPPRWASPIFRPSISRVPLIFVWPGHIEGGQWFSDPVSMIDVLPTVLDLVGLPQPEAKQGQSLAPLLLGMGDVEPRPVIFDEFEVDQGTGELQGVVEVVDGRWGASLWIGPELDDPEEWGWRITDRRPMPLLLFDLWNDPWCLKPVNEQHPDLVEKYTAFLGAQWEAHQALAQLFTPSESVALTPEQLETLRALGYIQ